MQVNHIFYKAYLINALHQHIQPVRQQLLSELTAAGTDSVVFMRRFRMLGQLADWESQVTKKIYSFETDSAEDYLIEPFVSELNMITSRDG